MNDEKNFQLMQMVQKLNKLCEDSTLLETDLKVLLDTGKIDYGKTLRTRMNYFVTLGIIRSPQPVFYGKGRGGSRLYQRDIELIIDFVNEQRKSFSFNEIAGVIRERREDLTRKYFNEIDFEFAGDQRATLYQTALDYSKIWALFDERLIKGSIISLKLAVLNDKVTSLLSEQRAIDKMKSNIYETICQDDQGIIDAYLKKIEGAITQHTNDIQELQQIAHDLLASFDEE